MHFADKTHVAANIIDVGIPGLKPERWKELILDWEMPSSDHEIQVLARMVMGVEI